MRILLRTCYDLRQTRKRETPCAMGAFDIDAEGADVSWEPSAERALAGGAQARDSDRDEALDVRDALGRLAADDRLVLVLFYVNDFPVRQISQIMKRVGGCSAHPPVAGAPIGSRLLTGTDRARKPRWRDELEELRRRGRVAAGGGRRAGCGSAAARGAGQARRRVRVAGIHLPGSSGIGALGGLGGFGGLEAAGAGGMPLERPCGPRRVGGRPRRAPRRLGGCGGCDRRAAGRGRFRGDCASADAVGRRAVFRWRQEPAGVRQPARGRVQPERRSGRGCRGRRGAGDARFRVVRPQHRQPVLHAGEGGRLRPGRAGGLRRLAGERVGALGAPRPALLLRADKRRRTPRKRIRLPAGRVPRGRQGEGHAAHRAGGDAARSGAYRVRGVGELGILRTFRRGLRALRVRRGPRPEHGGAAARAGRAGSRVCHERGGEDHGDPALHGLRAGVRHGGAQRRRGGRRGERPSRLPRGRGLHHAAHAQDHR